MAYLHHSVNVRSCGATATDRGSPGGTQNQRDASQLQQSIRSQGHGEEGWLGLPDWHLPKHQLGQCGEHTLGYLHMATGICTEMSSRQIPTRVPHSGKKQLQHTNVKVVNIKTKIPEFRKAGMADLQTELNNQLTRYQAS